MSIEQIQETIDGYYESMCSGDGCIEQECSDMIDYWESQNESIELVLN